MIFHEEPENFREKFRVVSCFVELDGKILLLKRQGHKPQGGTWGVPAGKVWLREGDRDAMARELFEETGIKIAPHTFCFKHEIFVRYSEYDFRYVIYTATPTTDQCTVNPKEHKDFRWVEPKEALNMTLIQDLDACITLVYSIKK